MPRFACDSMLGGRRNPPHPPTPSPTRGEGELVWLPSTWERGEGERGGRGGEGILSHALTGPRPRRRSCPCRPRRPPAFRRGPDRHTSPTGTAARAGPRRRSPSGHREGPAAPFFPPAPGKAYNDGKARPGGAAVDHRGAGRGHQERGDAAEPH